MIRAWRGWYRRSNGSWTMRSVGNSWASPRQRTGPSLASSVSKALGQSSSVARSSPIRCLRAVAPSLSGERTEDVLRMRPEEQVAGSGKHVQPAARDRLREEVGDPRGDRRVLVAVPDLGGDLDLLGPEAPRCDIEKEEVVRVSLRSARDGLERGGIEPAAHFRVGQNRLVGRRPAALSTVARVHRQPFEFCAAVVDEL